MAKHAWKKTYEILLAALATDVEGTYPLFVAPFAGKLESVEYFPNAAITGVNTNSRKIALINKGAAGSGTTEMAALDFVSGVNGVAFDAKTITLDATEADRAFAEGDVIAVASTAPGSGLADPGGLLRVVVSRTAE